MNFLDQFPSKEQVESFIRNLDRQDADARAAGQQRMENYYNCVDDYSFGGICDQAADEARGKRMIARQQLTEQVMRGTPFIDEFTQEVLTDLEGNVVSERTINGKYGRAWITKDGVFVNVVKNRQTYARKGYQIKTRTFSVEYYFTTKMGKHGLFSVSRIVSTEMKEWDGTFSSAIVPKLVYFAENYNR